MVNSIMARVAKNHATGYFKVLVSSILVRFRIRVVRESAHFDNLSGLEVPLAGFLSLEPPHDFLKEPASLSHVRKSAADNPPYREQTVSDEFVSGILPGF